MNSIDDFVTSHHEWEFVENDTSHPFPDIRSMEWYVMTNWSKKMHARFKRNVELLTTSNRHYNFSVPIKLMTYVGMLMTAGLAERTHGRYEGVRNRLILDNIKKWGAEALLPTKPFLKHEKQGA